MHIVSVNDVTIPHAAIAREVQNHARIVRGGLGSRRPGRWSSGNCCCNAPGRSISRPLPRVQDGARETDEEALIRLLLESEVRTPRADEAVCRRYYDSHPARFRSPDLFEPAHILFKARREDAAAYGKALAQAEAVLAELLKHPDRFEALARSLSDCPSATEGGRLGQVVRGDTTPEFETFLVALAPGPALPDTGVHALRRPSASVGSQERRRDAPVRGRPRPDRRLSGRAHLAPRGRAIHRAGGRPGANHGFRPSSGHLAAGAIGGDRCSAISWVG